MRHAPAPCRPASSSCQALKRMRAARRRSLLIRDARSRTSKVCVVIRKASLPRRPRRTSPSSSRLARPSSSSCRRSVDFPAPGGPQNHGHAPGSVHRAAVQDEQVLELEAGAEKLVDPRAPSRRSGGQRPDLEMAGDGAARENPRFAAPRARAGIPRAAASAEDEPSWWHRGDCTGTVRDFTGRAARERPAQGRRPGATFPWPNRPASTRRHRRLHTRVRHWT